MVFGLFCGADTRCPPAAPISTRMKLYSGRWACCGCGMCTLAPFRELAVKSVGEPDAGNPPVRFDERGKETTGCQYVPVQRPSSTLCGGTRLVSRSKGLKLDGGQAGCVQNQRPVSAPCFGAAARQRTVPLRC